MNNYKIHDVVIAGGGAAGLSAALLLGRCLRDTVLCDAGRSDIESFPSTGGFLGHDGCHPSELLRMGREQVAKFDTVTQVAARIGDVQRTIAGFTVICMDGRKLETRTLLVTPGQVPVLPEITGARDFHGSSLHQFPCGDGWDHQHQQLGVLGGSDGDVELALKLLIWSSRVTLFSNGEEVSMKSRQLLAQNRIMIETRPLVELLGAPPQLETVRLEDGTCMPCQALFYSSSEMYHSRLAAKLGCDARHLGSGNRWLPDGGSGIQGLFVAGNPFKAPDMAIIAAANGVKAAEEVDRWLSESARSYLGVKSA
ncbi:MAG: FAD-dependent oxidoreductase [Luteolibacter sp.]|uniref:FAD-dependent oxidoreductase n=1 Tax=Luteolibacter sp. TaxID=1962973 RepID=UPI003264A200